MSMAFLDSYATYGKGDMLSQLNPKSTNMVSQVGNCWS